ncbi:MAG: hypothetical protein JWN34_5229, partial [Bryobacterales bacterium]|nr:hypothetical protein [Bryobacterales bacterium]
MEGAAVNSVATQVQAPLVPATPALPPVTSDATTLAELLAIFHDARPKDDFSQIEKAYEFAEHCHTGQARASGEPYIL